jgi:hypothetical protein
LGRDIRPPAQGLAAQLRPGEQPALRIRFASPLARRYNTGVTRIEPKLTPSGHIELSGVTYRVVDDLETKSCKVVRDHDGEEMGRFRMEPLGSVPSSNAVMAGAHDPDLVLAIARLLAAPRGALPLQ